MDIPTLFIVATCITALLGLFLLVLWIQDRSVRALGWWAVAYLIGGVAVALWMIEPLAALPGINQIASALLFVACGLIWSGARVFHGRDILLPASVAGAIVWLMASPFPAISQSNSGRIVLSSLIIACYAVLTAIELRRDRRNPERARLRTILVPVTHGAVFLSPILSMHLFPDSGIGSGREWFAMFALLTLIYVVGTAFIVVVMAKERAVLIHKTAASTDPLTGLFNRRGFMEAAQQLVETQRRRGQPVTVLMFDLDHFKSINDRFGHDVGDDALRMFGATIAVNMRTNDVVGRLGGEEFAAILPGSLANAVPVAERVRVAFQAAGVTISGHAIGATVSIGAAGASASACEISSLLSRADQALYRAKTAGRNRISTEHADMVEDLIRAAGASAVPAPGDADQQALPVTS